MVENNKIIFKIEDYVLPCSYKKCKNNSAVHYSINGKEKHLCKNHFNEEINMLNEQGIDTNVNEINKHFAKRAQNTCLKQADFNDFSHQISSFS